MDAALTSSVYVHAPFCVRRCVYCDFAVDVRRTGDVDGWLSAIAAELDGVRAEGAFRLADRLDTLYVGGGTPSLLGADAMSGLARALAPARVDAPGVEWTAEANPESFTPDVADGWRRAGVNRVSLGVQSFSPEALRWMGRLHGPDGARNAVRVAREAGFENVSVDLIFGLPARLGRSWSDDLSGALSLDVEHVSLYGLSVEPATPLGKAVAAGRESPVDDERYRDEFLEAAEALTSAGYEHYEVSNFARPGRSSRHNAVYWEGGPYLGLGNGAHSYAPPMRRWNERAWTTYRDRVAERGLAVAGDERLDPAQERLERVWLELRTSRGVALDGLGASGAEQVEAWARDGLATLRDGRAALTAEGWLLLDRLALELDVTDAG